MELNTQLHNEIKESLKNWKQIVESYQIPNTRKAIIQIINTFIPYCIFWVLMYFSLRWSIWAFIGLGLINSFFLVRIFIIQHDCGHQSFLKSKKWNNIIGYFCSFFSFIPYRYWARVHNFHHGHSGQLEVWDIGDIPTLTVKQFENKKWYGKIIYIIWRIPIVTFIIAPVFYLLVSNRFPIIRLSNFKHLSWSQFKNNVSIFAGYVILGFVLGWAQFLIVQFFIIFCFGVIAFWFFYVQHQHEHAYKQWKDNWNYIVAAIKGSTYYKLPKIVQWLTGNIGIHHVHHLSSLIPNYNLEKCMKENAILNKYVTILTFWDSLKLMTHKLWDEERERMISFREYFRMRKHGIA